MDDNRLARAAGGGGGLGPMGGKTGFSGWIGGRCRRREYWMWVVPLTILLFALSLTGAPGVSLIPGIPMLLIWIRRYHDLGRSGWFAPLTNVAINGVGFAAMAFMSPMAGGLVAMGAYVAAVVVLGAIPGQPRRNAFGYPPGGGATSDVAETFS